MINQVPSVFQDRRVSVVGLGYVGLTLAVAMADCGFKVHGVEIRDDVLDGLKSLEPHFFEPRLKEKLARIAESGAFTFGKDFGTEPGTSVYIITVGTPLDADGQAQLQSVKSVTAAVAEHAAENSLVILRSTVKIGTARSIVKPILDAAGKSLKLAVCPERTLEGRALIELHELPQVIGADDPATRMRCMQLFNLITRTTVAVESLETAEVVKLVDNTFRDVMFGFANEIAELCGEVGISAAEVIQAGKLGYERTNVALPGPVGGPCLEKDPHILAESGQLYGVDMSITRASRKVNEAMPERAAGHVLRWSQSVKNFPTSPTISLLGLAFKGVPPTDDLRGTMAKPILKALQNAFPTATFRGYDAVVPAKEARSFFGIEPIEDLADAFRNSDVVLIMNNHPIFRTLDLGAMAENMNRPGLVYDFWNMHADVDRLPAGLSLMPLGSEVRSMKLAQSQTALVSLLA